MKNKSRLPEWKYTIRKLGFLLLLAALIASPFGVQAYRSANTTDPYILMAREIEASTLGVDVIEIHEDAATTESEIPDGFGALRTVNVLVHIEDYLKWSEKEKDNFNRRMLQIARIRGYTALTLAIGWNYTPEEIHIQKIVVCLELKIASCKSITPPDALPINPEFILWPGIGKP